MCVLLILECWIAVYKWFLLCHFPNGKYLAGHCCFAGVRIKLVYPSKWVRSSVVRYPIYTRMDNIDSANSELNFGSMGTVGWFACPVGPFNASNRFRLRWPGCVWPNICTCNAFISINWRLNNCIFNYRPRELYCDRTGMLCSRQCSSCPPYNQRSLVCHLIIVIFYRWFPFRCEDKRRIVLQYW